MEVEAERLQGEFKKVERKCKELEEVELKRLEEECKGNPH